MHDPKMTADTAPAWDGVPSNPERNGWHWLKDDERVEPVATIWSAELGSWVSGAAYSPSGVVELGFCYLGPCLTHSEVAAREAAAWAAGAAAMREEAAADVDCGCDQRDVVLARLESQGHKRASYLCQNGDICCALQAEAIRHLPLPPMPTN